MSASELFEDDNIYCLLCGNSQPNPSEGYQDGYAHSECIDDLNRDLYKEENGSG